MSRFPLEPQYSKALLNAAFFDIPDKMVTLVSLLSTESIWKKVLKINEEEYNDYIEKSKKFFLKLVIIKPSLIFTRAGLNARIQIPIVIKIF